MLGGPPTPGIGFGSGIERVILEMQKNEVEPSERPIASVFVVHRGAATATAAIRAANALRAAGLPTVVGEGERSFKSQMRSADASGAQVAVILGEDEVARGTAIVKDLRGDGGQRETPLQDVADSAEALLASFR